MKLTLSEKYQNQSLWTRIFGFPVWVECRSGDVLKKRAWWLPNGKVRCQQISGFTIADEDGTVPQYWNSYVKCWYHR